MIKFQLNKLIFTFLIAFSLATTAAANQCSSFFYSDPFIKQKMNPEMARSAAEAVKNLKENTTGARIENKWTLNRKDVESLIKNLKKELSQFNISIQARDPVKPGTKNVTLTVYLQQFKLNLKDSGLEVGTDFNLTKVTFKPRIRKYGTIATDKQVTLENIDFADFTKNFSFVEFKFPDARFKGAVFKPRMYMADQYIQMFGTPEFLKNYPQIMKNTLSLKLNAADQDSVKSMLHFFLLGHQQHFKFSKIATNLYERISLAINFIDHNINEAPFQIQMTLDKSISLFVYELGRTIEAYHKDHSVVEIKTPVEYAKYSLNSDLSQIPGYHIFLKFINDIRQHHLPEYKEGVGKNGHGHLQFLKEVDNPSRTEKRQLPDVSF